jgi:hypothetical protein
MVKYFHLRYRWIDLIDDMNPHGIAGQGGVTVGIKNGHDDPNIVEFAFAICSLVDNFNRKIGRRIVDGRFQTGDYRRFTFDSTVSDDERVGIIIEAVVDKALSKLKVSKDERELYAEALQ